METSDDRGGLAAALRQEGKWLIVYSYVIAASLQLTLRGQGDVWTGRRPAHAPVPSDPILVVRVVRHKYVTLSHGGGALIL
jgi:hypothetical protein